MRTTPVPAASRLSGVAPAADDDGTVGGTAGPAGCTAVRGGPGRRRYWPVVTRRHLVVSLGILWILDGVLQLQPYMFSSDYVVDVLQYNTMGPPTLVTRAIRDLVTLTYGTPTRQVAYNTLAAVVQLGLGAAMIWWRRAERPALAASFAWGLVPWLVGEGLGGMLWPQSSMFLMGAPGAAVLYSLLSVVLWPRRRPGGGQLPAPADDGVLGGTGARAVWAVVWMGTGLLELERSNWAPDAISAQLRVHASGEPGWLGGLDRVLANASAGRGTAIALFLLMVQVLVGWWVMRASTRRLSLALGVGVSLFYWVAGQDFGSILAGKGTDPNLGPLMVLLALALWPRRVLAVPATAGAPRRVGLARRCERDLANGSNRGPGRPAPGRRRWPVAGVTAVVALGVSGAVGRGLALNRAAQNADLAHAPGVGAAAPAGEFTTSPGHAQDISGVPRPALLWFVATWCQSCGAGTAAIASHLGQLRDDGVHVVELELAGDLGQLGPSESLRQLAYFSRSYAGRARSDPAWTWGVASPALSHAYDPTSLLDVYYLVGADGRIVYRGELLAGAVSPLMSHAAGLRRP